jgi:hypothetical protein
VDIRKDVFTGKITTYFASIFKNQNEIAKYIGNTVRLANPKGIAG